MISVDTNVLVRVLVRDDAEELRLAAAIMATESLWLPKTVLFELEWVLRYAYELSREIIGESIRKLLGLRNLHVEDRAEVLRALDWYAGGMDFAGALHLASSADAHSFATFDRELARRAPDQGAAPSVRLLTES